MCFVYHVVLIRSPDGSKTWTFAVSRIIRILARASVVHSNDPEFLPLPLVLDGGTPTTQLDLLPYTSAFDQIPRFVPCLDLLPQVDIADYPPLAHTTLRMAFGDHSPASELTRLKAYYRSIQGMAELSKAIQVA
jgi:hypothetical protein